MVILKLKTNGGDRGWILKRRGLENKIILM